MKKNLMLPGNPRYQPPSLQPYFGYDNLMRPVGEVELATREVLDEIGVIPPSETATLTAEKREALLNITTSEVDEVERTITHHDIRAWVRLAQEIVGKPLNRWLHIPLTSYDALETARTIAYCRAHEGVVKQRVAEVASTFVDLARRFAHTMQIGRTHGQHALPITVGFWFATVLSRILTNFEEMERFRQHLVGKISGAVGTHNAEIALGFARRSEETESERLTGQDGASFEERVLRKLGLKPAPISTQILPPEPLAYYLHAAVLLSAALGQFGRDCRHLMRSEVGEIAESFEEGQVGSSTMAQKRNPTRFENLEGMYLRSAAEYEKVLATLISEHQRDLVGSSVMRDFPVIIVNLVYQLETLLRKNDKGISFLRRIAVNEDACRRNLAASESTRLAEPFYIALQMAGWQGDAHELINRRAVPMCTGATSLHHAVTHLANEDPELKAAFCRIPDEVRVLLCRPDEPERYAGNAAKQAQMIAHQAEKKIIEWTS